MKKLTLADYIREFPQLDKEAMVYKTGFRTLRYSYGEVYENSLKVAAFLQQQGVKKGDKAIIWAPNSPEWGIFFLGCILNGVIAVPIDVRSDRQYLNHVQQQAKAKIVFQTKYRPKYLDVKTFFAEDLDILISGCTNKPTLPEIKESDVVELLYTSGTTAAPKGVMLTHRNIVSNLESLRKVIEVNEEYRLLSVLPLSHVFEQTVGFFLPLAVGAAIVYLRTLKPSALIEAVKEEKITVTLVVPRILLAFEDSIVNELKRKRLYAPFKCLAFAAAKLPFSLRKYLFFPLHAKFGSSFKFFGIGGAPFDKEQEIFWHRLGFLVLQGYGLTETSPIVTFNSLDERKLGSVGKVLPGVEVITEEDGEILVKGPNITQGYYRDEGKTKAAFSNGWLKTGDIGVFDKDSFLFLKGRAKDAIITGEGLNVYAEDVEAVLNSMAGIKDSAVIGVKTKEGEHVHAVVLTALDDRALSKAVADANKKLLDYQQIQGYDKWPYEDFPRTPTLKTKKNIVREYVARQKKLPEHSVLPQKNKLYTIIAKVSHTQAQAITPKSVLTADLHLSSIDRIELVSYIEQEFNIDLDETLITGNTTVEQLENIITARKSGEKLKQRDWVRRFPINQLRFLVQHLIMFPTFRIFCKLEVKGRENLENLKGPAVFIANHTSHFDTPLIMMALPLRLRTKLSPGAWGEFHTIRHLPKKYIVLEKSWKIFVYNFYSLFANAYLLEQTTRPLQSLQYSGKLVDNGWSPLIFPEGERTSTGAMQPFKQGVGMLAYELMVPVVPVKVEGLWEIFPQGSIVPKTVGKVTVKFGRPIPYSGLRGKSYIEITKALEEAVKKL